MKFTEYPPFVKTPLKRCHTRKGARLIYVDNAVGNYSADSIEIVEAVRSGVLNTVRVINARGQHVYAHADMLFSVTKTGIAEAISFIHYRLKSREQRAVASVKACLEITIDRLRINAERYSDQYDYLVALKSKL